jgi:hypothetical protein
VIPKLRSGIQNVPPKYVPVRFMRFCPRAKMVDWRNVQVGANNCFGSLFDTTLCRCLILTLGANRREYLGWLAQILRNYAKGRGGKSDQA